MTDSPRKSQRLKVKDRDKQAANRTLKIKLSKESEEDEDMSVLQVKQSITPRATKDFDMRRYKHKRSNNFLRVHNDYCTYDSYKYDGYDSKFIHDSDPDSCNSEEVDRYLERDKITKPKRIVTSGSSENDSGSGGSVDPNKSEKSIEGKRKRLGGGKRGEGDVHNSDDDLISPARKLKMSVLSSDESDSETPLRHKPTPSSRGPSSRAMKVRARVMSDREKQFANFRAKRNRNNCGKGEAKQEAVTSVPNLGDIKRLIYEEKEVLPFAHQELVSKFCSCKELFGDSGDSLSDDDDVAISQLSSDYTEAKEHTKLIVDSQADTRATTNPQPPVYQFSERRSGETTHVLVSDNEAELTVTGPVDSEGDLSPNIFLSTLSEFQDFDPDSTTGELGNIEVVTTTDNETTLEVNPDGNIQEDEKRILAERFDLEFSPVADGVKIKSIQDEVISSFSDSTTEVPARPHPTAPSSSDELDDFPFVIDYSVN